MTIHEKCPLCDTALEMTAEDGIRYRFTAHGEDLCRAATKHRIEALEHARKSDAELYARRAEDAILAERERCATIVLGASGGAVPVRQSFVDDIVEKIRSGSPSIDSQRAMVEMVANWPTESLD